MNARHTPSEERLLAYAAGTLSPPEAVVVAAHLAMRPESAAWVRSLQGLGGQFLADTEPVAMSKDSLSVALARVEVDAGDVVAPAPLNDMPELPEPLRRYALGPWRWIGPDMYVCDVHAPRDGNTRVILLKIGPGRSAPSHTHDGPELTCVLSGAYVTDEARFEAGDFEEAGPDVLHRPRTVSDEPCLCVAAVHGQIRLPGLIGKILRPFVRL